MSTLYKKVEYECDCGQDYGNCEKTGKFIIKYEGVSDLNILYFKGHPDDEVRELGVFTDKQLDALGKLLTSKWDVLNDLSEDEIKEVNK